MRGMPTLGWPRAREVHEFDLADAEFDPIESAGLSLLRLSVPARLLMVAAAAALLWSAVFWALA